MINEGKLGKNIAKPEEKSNEKLIGQYTEEELRAKLIKTISALTEVSEEINSCPESIAKDFFTPQTEEEKMDRKRLDILREQKEFLEKEREKYSRELSSRELSSRKLKE